MTVDELIKELKKYPRDMRIAVKGGVDSIMDGFTPVIEKVSWVQDGSERLLITKGRWEWYQKTY